MRLERRLRDKTPSRMQSFFVTHAARLRVVRPLPLA